MNTTINSHDLYDRISNKEQFYELFLTQEGNLYIDSTLENAADSFCIYYNGNVCCIQGANRYVSGFLPKDHLTFPTFVGETSFHDVEGTSCLLHSKEPVLPEDASVFAVFQYKDTLGLYVADSMISRGIHFALMESTPEAEVLYTNIFFRLLHKHDSKAAEKAATWLDLHTADSKEV